MTSSAFGLLLIVSAASQVIYSSSPGGLVGKELEEQKEVYKQLWNTDLVVKLADLPVSGSVPDENRSTTVSRGAKPLAAKPSTSCA